MTKIALSAATFASPTRRQNQFFCLVGLLLSLVFASPALPAARGECRQSDGKVVKNLPGGAQVEFTPTKNEDFVFGNACQAVVRDSAQNVVFSEEDFSFSLTMADSDVNGDGVPDLVLESYSGGAHCCWTYYIISLGAKPHLIKQFDNERGVSFVHNAKNGRIDIVTQDGTFDYFDEQCHACTAFPVVYLRLEGDKFVDVGSEHLADYDEIIAKSQQSLSSEERQSLRSAKGSPYETETASDATAKVLSIVFAYLYSGREAQARQALGELWPPFDQERIWKLIVETRQRGVLSQARPAAPKSAQIQVPYIGRVQPRSVGLTAALNFWPFSFKLSNFHSEVSDVPRTNANAATDRPTIG